MLALCGHMFVVCNMVAITLPADFTALNFSHGLGCFYSMLAHFVSGVW
jgi:hypothetical protein